MRVDDRLALADWLVRGPQGQFYGRYKDKPTPDQIPLYAMAVEERPGPRMKFNGIGADESVPLMYKVEDEAGNPLPNVEVKIIEVTTKDIGYERTNEDGVAQFMVKPWKPYKVLFFGKGGYQDKEWSAAPAPGEDMQVIQMKGEVGDEFPWRTVGITAAATAGLLVVLYLVLKG
jgi:hypothetical protein